MKPAHRPLIRLALVALTIASVAPLAIAQIRILGGDDASYFTSDTPDLPHTADIGSARDVFISDDLEVGGRLFTDKIIHVNRDAENLDQFIYFSDDASNSDESISWDDSADAFSMSNDLDLLEGANGSVRIRARADNELDLYAEAPEMFFLIDSNSNDNAAVVDHTFTWSNNSTAASQRAMVLRSVTGAVGNLELNGTLSENVAFDIAESFFMTEPVEAGRLVAVDPRRPDAVVAATASDRARVLGVVSTRPGILMGGGAFSVEALRESWGEVTASLFLQEQAGLEAEVLGTNEALRQRASELSSVGAFGAMVRAREAELALSDARSARFDDDSDGPDAAKIRSEAEIRSAYEDALRGFEVRLGDAVMKKFFARHFAPVALAGRVPVEVDASYGAVRPGDLLTVSPTPGVARRAGSPGAIVGTALEGLERGRGRILMLVHRGTVGESRTTGGDALAELRAENRRLHDRLARLERAVARTGLEVPRRAASSGG